MKMKVSIGVSARHIHLSKDDFEILFPNEELNVKNELSQYPNFASDKVVTIRNKDREYKNVRVIGPLRNDTQIELSKTDCYYLKIDAPLCNSGELENAAEIEIINGNKTIKRKCVIIQNRHIHMNYEDAKKCFTKGKNTSNNTESTIKYILSNYLTIGTVDNILDINI